MEEYRCAKRRKARDNASPEVANKTIALALRRAASLHCANPVGRYLLHLPLRLFRSILMEFRGVVSAHCRRHSEQRSTKIFGMSPGERARLRRHTSAQSVGDLCGTPSQKSHVVTCCTKSPVTCPNSAFVRSTPLATRHSRSNPRELGWYRPITTLLKDQRRRPKPPPVISVLLSERPPPFRDGRHVQRAITRGERQRRR